MVVHHTQLPTLPEYSMAIQACIPPALATVHNFICIHNEDEILEFEGDLEDGEPGECDYGELAKGLPSHAEKICCEVKQDELVQAMWESYQALVHEGMHDGQE